MPNFNFMILLISIYSLVCRETYPLKENSENPFGDNEEKLWGNGIPIDFSDGDNDEYIPWGNDGPIDFDDDEYIPWGKNGPIDLPWNDGPNDFDDDEYIPWGNDGPIDLPWNDGPNDFDDDEYIPWGNDGPIDFE